jgi:hypothetical protein
LYVFLDKEDSQQFLYGNNSVKSSVSGGSSPAFVASDYFGSCTSIGSASTTYLQSWPNYVEYPDYGFKVGSHDYSGPNIVYSGNRVTEFMHLQEPPDPGPFQDGSFYTNPDFAQPCGWDGVLPPIKYMYSPTYYFEIEPAPNYSVKIVKKDDTQYFYATAVIPFKDASAIVVATHNGRYGEYVSREVGRLNSNVQCFIYWRPDHPHGEIIKSYYPWSGVLWEYSTWGGGGTPEQHEILDHHVDENQDNYDEVNVVYHSAHGVNSIYTYFVNYSPGESPSTSPLESLFDNPPLGEPYYNGWVQSNTPYFSEDAKVELTEVTGSPGTSIGEWPDKDDITPVGWI